MEIKLLAIDIDGTLVGRNNRVSSENIAAVKKARELGIKIVLCTGRINSETEYVAVDLGGCDYIITCNGSMVYDNVNRHHIAFNVLPYSVVDRVLSILEELDIFYQIYVDDGTCIPANQYHKFMDLPMTDGYKAMFYETQWLLENPRRDIPEKNLDVFKFFIPNYDLQLLESIRLRLNRIPGLDVTFSSKYGMEVVLEGMDKLHGMNRLLQHLNLTFDDIMVLGDSENDLQLIKAAKYGVAMGNAPDFIKNAAKYHTETNEEHGVAHAIQRLILTPVGVSLE